MRAWFDSHAAEPAAAPGRGIDWPRVLPFIALHLGCLAVLWTGWSATAVLTALALYAVRMFAITGFYHRYFSHKAFRTSRALQLAFALLGASAVQRGPLWWASQHRHHHAHADGEQDAHSPHRHGFLWAHLGWFLARENFATRLRLVRDLARLYTGFDLVDPTSPQETRDADAARVDCLVRIVGLVIPDITPRAITYHLADEKSP